MIKKINRNLKGVLLVAVAVFLLLNSFLVAKTRVDIDGSVNINFGRRRDRNGDYWGNNGNNNNNRRYNNVGDMTDSQYDSVPFILNGRGYAIFRNRSSFYILQAEFINGNPNNVRSEQIFNATAITQNCVAITGDNKYCLTITSNGIPALWDRYAGRIKYTGRWVGRGNYDYDYDYYRSNQSEHWFEW